MLYVVCWVALGTHLTFRVPNTDGNQSIYKLIIVSKYLMWFCTMSLVSSPTAPEECQDGMVWSECANRCPHTCMDVRLGTCVEEDDDCIPGRVTRVVTLWDGIECGIALTCLLSILLKYKHHENVCNSKTIYIVLYKSCNPEKRMCKSVDPNVACAKSTSLV